LGARAKALFTDVAAMSACAAFLFVLGVHIPAVFTHLLHGAMAVLQ
jgi:hypothetical protein